jgi:hypothetical protein
VDLLITTVHRINARAEAVVTGEFVAELKRVSGKENILFKMTGAALDAPKGPVEEVIYPAVPGGVDTLVALWREYNRPGRWSALLRPTPLRTVHATCRGTRPKQATRAAQVVGCNTVFAFAARAGLPVRLQVACTRWPVTRMRTES